jgi:hypothetical protein
VSAGGAIDTPCSLRLAYAQVNEGASVWLLSLPHAQEKTRRRERNFCRQMRARSTPSFSRAARRD